MDHEFGDPELLVTALTHRSAGPLHNERLEFLGDAVLGYLIAESLYGRSSAREGILTRTRASLVRKESLAELAREINLDRYLILGAGERKTGGRYRESILADALEAVIGAVYIDGGRDRAREVVDRLFGARLSMLENRDVGKDPKTRLQEWLQGRQLALPTYEVHDLEECPEGQRFTVICRVSLPPMAVAGEGATRRMAEQNAAAQVLCGLHGVESADEAERTT